MKKTATETKPATGTIYAKSPKAKLGYERMLAFLEKIGLANGPILPMTWVALEAR